MFFKSIRWRLQLWYGLILIVVLSGFGFTAYQLQRSREFRDLDAEVQRRISALAAMLRPPPRDRGPGENRPGPPLFDEDRPPRPLEDLPNRPFRDRPPNNFPSEPREFRLPPPQTRLFEGSETNSFYFVVWSRTGGEIARSTNALSAIPTPTAVSPSAPPATRMRGSFRETFLSTPRGDLILVGHSAATELADLHQVAWRFIGVGTIVLLLGLAGGGWIAARAIRPVQDISATALKISAGDLSQRINARDTDSELGQLAGVLNSTFARLDAAFTQQSRFTADAAHELRTPVSVMLTQTQTALARDRNAAEYRETIESCQRAAQRMRQLIESLLELARLDAGQETMKRMSFDLSKITHDCVELINPLAAERGIKFECDLAPTESSGDPERIAQVITNLLTNAIHYNRDNGKVCATVQSSDDMALLTVSDTGEGISSEDLPHIFERFYRAEKSRSSGRTGLGLAISKAIVEAHGGTIEVSNELDKGTTFTVRLPLI